MGTQVTRGGFGSPVWVVVDSDPDPPSFSCWPERPWGPTSPLRTRRERAPGPRRPRGVSSAGGRASRREEEEGVEEGREEAGATTVVGTRMPTRGTDRVQTSQGPPAPECVDARRRRATLPAPLPRSAGPHPPCARTEAGVHKARAARLGPEGAPGSLGWRRGRGWTRRRRCAETDPNGPAPDERERIVPVGRLVICR